MFSLFLPEKCLHCEEPTAHARNPKTEEPFSHYLCEVCIRILMKQDPPAEQTVRDEFLRNGTGTELSHCLAAYTFMAGSPIQSIIHAFKYDGMIKLAEQFGKSIATFVPHEIDVIVPVPLHRTRLAERGYNQAEVLSDGMTSKPNLHIVQAAKRIRPTPSQTHLSLPKRIENMRGAFTLSRHAEHIKGKHILIVDDVMTTGSTLASVAETLLEARPKSISTLALAIAEQPSRLQLDK